MIVISNEARGKQNIEIYLVYFKGWISADTLSNKQDILKVWVGSFLMYSTCVLFTNYTQVVQTLNKINRCSNYDENEKNEEHVKAVMIFCYLEVYVH